VETDRNDQPEHGALPYVLRGSRVPAAVYDEYHLDERTLERRALGALDKVADNISLFSAASLSTWSTRGPCVTSRLGWGVNLLLSPACAARYNDLVEVGRGAGDGDVLSGGPNGYGRHWTSYDLDAARERANHALRPWVALGATPLGRRQFRLRIALEHRQEFRQPASMPAGPSPSRRASGTNPSSYSRELRVTRWHAKASAESWNRSAIWLSGGGGLVRTITPPYVTRPGGGCSDANRLYIQAARLSASVNWSFPR
jgi:hypothetical protein